MAQKTIWGDDKLHRHVIICTIDTFTLCNMRLMKIHIIIFKKFKSHFGFQLSKWNWTNTFNKFQNDNWKHFSSIWSHQIWFLFVWMHRINVCIMHYQDRGNSFDDSDIDLLNDKGKSWLLALLHWGLHISIAPLA